MVYANAGPMDSAGSILNIQFKIKANTTNQAININLTVEELIDSSLINIPFSVIQGTIDVIGILLGDVNNDGNISPVDALMALQATSGELTLTDSQKNVADVNKDGVISSADALDILQYASGKITSF